MTDAARVLLSGRPTGPVEVPRAVVDLVGPAPDVVWRNEAGGLTFRLDGAYLKWAPRGSGIDLGAEFERLAWAGRHAAVPVVVDRGWDHEGAWFVTTALPGRSAADPRWLADPATAARAVGEGLRALHDALDVDDCPFDWGVPARLDEARRRAAGGPTAEPAARAAARAALGAPPPVDRLVVCHGDACVPNTLLDDDGRWTAHVDLGALGVADRWADLAIATWSTVWNYGPGYEDVVLDAYGVAPDEERTAFYRRLWDAT